MDVCEGRRIRGGNLKKLGGMGSAESLVDDDAHAGSGHGPAAQRKSLIRGDSLSKRGRARIAMKWSRPDRNGGNASDGVSYPTGDSSFESLYIYNWKWMTR